MTRKLIVNLAPTGMVPTTADNPCVPVTPERIAADCAASRAHGAAIFHLHIRDDEERPDYRAERYRDTIRAVRKAVPDGIICVSTSGRNFKTFEQRSEVLSLTDDVQPEMASLTLGSMNFPKQASVNEPEMIRRLAEEMKERGIVPELEVFDFGMIDYAKYLIERRVLAEPFYFNLLLGSLGTSAATAFNLSTMVMSLPSSATWAAAGIGRFQFRMNTLAIAMGGNVRIGLEDNLYFDEEKKRPASNPGLVERIARVAASMERECATPDEARAMIGLASR